MAQAVRPRQRTKGLLVQEYPDEILVYDTLTNQGYSLNRVSATVWRLCDGMNTIAGIVKEVAKHHRVKDPERYTLAALEELAGAGLLVRSNPRAPMSRRQAMGRVTAAVLGVSTFFFAKSARACC